MKIFAIYPKIGKNQYSISYISIYLKKMFGATINIIASKNDSYKGTDIGKEYEIMDDIPVYRLFNTTNEQFAFQAKYQQIFNIVINLRTDIIFVRTKEICHYLLN